MFHHDPNHPRPYWHVDAKWVCGLILSAALGASLLLFSLARLTDRDVIIPVASQILSGFIFKQGSLDDANGIDDLKRQAAAAGGTIHPLSDFPNVTLTTADLNTLTPRQIRLKLVSQIVEPFYTKGVDQAVAEATSNPDQQAQLKSQVGLLGPLSASNHQKLGGAAQVSLILVLLALIGVVGFSAGWGRLASPGVVALLTAGPLALVFTIIKLGVEHPGPDGSGPFQNPVVAALVPAVQPYYAWAALAGVGLLLAAGLGKLISRLLHRHVAPAKTP